MSDTSQGPGWWVASDGKWYPPHLAPPPPPPPPTEAGSIPPAAPTQPVAPVAPPQGVPPFDSSPGSPYGQVPSDDTDDAPTQQFNPPTQQYTPIVPPVGADTPQGPDWWIATDGKWYPPPRTLQQPFGANGAQGTKTPTPVYKRWWFWAAAAAVVLIVIIAATASASKKNNAANTATTVTAAPSVAPSATGASPTATAAPATTAPPATAPPTTAPAANQAAFSCTGSAPEGVNITYGTNTSNLNGGSSVPWQASVPLPATAQSAEVSAQLQGPDGNITCTTAVTWSSGGSSHTVTQTGTAAGNYNIADAQVCSDLNAGFQTC